MFIAIFVILALLAVFFFFWVMRSMLRAACPQCIEEGDTEMVIPLLPGFRWFCPACGGAYKNSEVLEAGKLVQSEEEGTLQEDSEGDLPENRSEGDS